MIPVYNKHGIYNIDILISFLNFFHCCRYFEDKFAGYLY
nr:MAG TPA: hypothetical protein [Caudoviricetes sp.]